MRYISDVVASNPELEDDKEYYICDMKNKNINIASMEVTKELMVLVRDEDRDIGTSDVPDLKTFQSSGRHTYVTTYDLSEQWGIRLSQDTRKIKRIIIN